MNLCPVMLAQSKYMITLYIYVFIVLVQTHARVQFILEVLEEKSPYSIVLLQHNQQ